MLRETAYKDSSKIMTVLTGTEGKLTVSARGALRKNSKLTSAAQLLVYSEMTLFSNRDRWTLTEARSVEQFSGLRSDVALLALGSYFAELTEAVADEDSPNPELLPLCLNALYALSETIKPPELIKPAFEMRLISITGLAPLISDCVICGSAAQDNAYLDLIGGNLKCSEHAVPNSAALSRTAIEAIKYIINCEPKKLFSFTLNETAQREIYQASEKYLLTQLDRKFRTLDYYNRIIDYARKITKNT